MAEVVDGVYSIEPDARYAIAGRVRRPPPGVADRSDVFSPQHFDDGLG